MASAGISGFTMDGRTGPSADSHRLLAWAAETRGQDAQHALAEALFETYFARGEPLCRHDVLASAAERAGLPRAEAEAVLADPARGTRELAEELQLGRQLGVTGVPFFRVTDTATGRVATVSGAQPPEALAEAVRRVMPVGAGAACKPGGECL
jgi:predicted DsbA family dithiol-disulfide isomerase